MWLCRPLRLLIFPAHQRHAVAAALPFPLATEALSGLVLIKAATFGWSRDEHLRPEKTCAELPGRAFSCSYSLPRRCWSCVTSMAERSVGRQGGRMCSAGIPRDAGHSPSRIGRVVSARRWSIVSAKRSCPVSRPVACLSIAATVY
jgi:hypothetical protein